MYIFCGWARKQKTTKQEQENKKIIVIIIIVMFPMDSCTKPALCGPLYPVPLTMYKNPFSKELTKGDVESVMIFQAWHTEICGVQRQWRLR